MKIICFILLSFVAIHTKAQDSEANKVTTPTKGILPFDVNKNVVSFNYPDLNINRVSLSYERLIKEGMLGIKVPVTFSIKSYPNGPKYNGGLGLNYYPFGHRRLTYYTGIMTNLGVYSSKYSRYDSWSYTNRVLSVGYYKNDHIYGSAYIVNGLVWNINKNFSISSQIGIGALDREGFVPGRLDMRGELNLSIRF